MADAGMDTSGLVRAMQRHTTISYQAVKKAVDGKSNAFSAANNAIAAAALGVRSDWLASGVGPKHAPTAYTPTAPLLASEPNVLALGDDDPLPDNVVLIKEYAVRFAAGDGHIATFDEIHESQPVPYLRSWMTAEHIPPSKARRFKVKGDSMKDTLFNGDTVLVNTAETHVIDGKVYAIRYGDELRVKRLFKRLDGGLILHSDNPEHRPRDEELSAPQVAEHIHIIGRVRDKSGAGGL